MRWLSLVLTFGAVLQGQTLYDLMGGSLGRPAPPPLIGFLGILAPGPFLTDVSIPPRGPVARATTKEFRRQSDGGFRLAETTTLEFSDQGREIFRQSEGGVVPATITTEWQGTSKRKITVTNSRTEPSVTEWRFDAKGRTVEYTVRHGGKIQNHFVNFRHDEEGRVLSMEYRQGADDVFSYSEAFSYDGNTVDFRKLRADGSEISKRITTTDAGRVVRARLESPGSPTLNVTFSWDSKGRMIRQETTDYPLPEGDFLGSIPPGVIVIDWDDERHTKHSSYRLKGQVLEGTLTFDGNGDVIGADLPGARTRFSCSYDQHNNWTDCEQQVGNQVSAKWKRTITYR